MTGLAQLEREALCATLVDVGPDAPTLCSPWTTRDLAAHLVIRERRPDALPGVLMPALADHTQRVQDHYAAGDWPALVDLVREGPPGWNPTRVPAVDDAINLGEFFVHHEDVLRAAPGWTPEQARTLSEDTQKALWSRMRQAGQLLFRRAPVGVVLHAAGHGRHSAKGPTKQGTVVIEGAPSELVLVAFGRGRVADVTYQGTDAAVEALKGAEFGV
ncbi:TIGR03085 family metal-binding protein [Mobilicoccus caccae]|uniref:TIGR03085 family protein n=1 Tax=Mobilicoccus caccae TaxID=1859295 RepID=A0ABQ6IND2_9MICO|nr:TIGR03085 family metal-binding protein [Mobilicoccus caccae]GMA39429.1 TIGR03085 family protein [Mobilicoccus caccae]